MRFILSCVTGAMLLASSGQAGVVRFATFPARHPVKTFHRPAKAASGAAKKTAKVFWKVVY